jgi:Protein of unknown function (DUF3570)
MNAVARIVRHSPRRWSLLWTMWAGVIGSALPNAVVAQQSSATVYVRTDTDKTTVITPRVSAQAPVGDATKVDVAYSMDVWTSASIDIRTSASRPVTERRDEINAALTHEFSDAAFSLAYRYSYEPDYESHFVNAGLTLDFADKASTVAIGGGVSFDDVGRVGTPSFERTLRTFTGQLSFTQVVDSKTLLQAVYSIGYYDGYQSSPYRYIGVGTLDGGCPPLLMQQTEFCFPEKNPEERLRHAFVLVAGRAFSDSISARATYRFYIDDWKLLSHTVLAELNWLADVETVLALRYRFYLQSAAAHYRARFPYVNVLRLRQYYSRDKELSPFNAHRVALELDRSWPLAGVGEKLTTVLSIGPTLYLYDNFIPYKRIWAFEATLSGVLVL